MKTVLFLSSIRDIPGPSFTSNGQSLVSSCSYDFLSSKFFLLRFLHSSALYQQVLYTLRVVLALPHIFFSRTVIASYIVISRSPFGFLRDSFIIFCLCFFRKPVFVHFHGRSLPFFLSSIVYKIFSLSCCKSYLHLVLPSTSFFLSNPSWRLFTYSEIYNFSHDFSPPPRIFNPKTNSRSSSSLSFSSSKKIIRITWNSNLIYSKGLILLMEAIYLYNTTSLTHFIHLDIFGDYISDEYCSADTLRTIVKRHSLKIPCSFFGSVERSVTVACLMVSDLYIFPSFYSSEYQPLSLIDAMSCGKPIISSSLSVLESLLRDYKNVHFLPSKITPSSLALSIDLFVRKELSKSSLPSSSPSYVTSFTKDAYLRSFSKLFTNL